MNKELEKTLRNAHEIKSEQYRVRVYVKSGVPYFCASDIAKVGGIKTPTKWIQSAIARNPNFQYVRILYPVMTVGGVRRFNLVFVTVEEGIRIMNSLPLFLETKRWMVEKVFAFKPDPNVRYYKEADRDIHKGCGESSYEKQIDSIIMELLEMKRSILNEKKSV